MSSLRPKLAWQIFPYFLLITVLSLLGLGWFASNRLRAFHLNQLTSELEARALLLRDLVAPHFEHDLQAVDAICRQASLDTQSRATVVLPSGAVIGESHLELSAVKDHSDRPEIIAALAGASGRAVRISDTIHVESLYVAVPIRIGGAVAGVARIAVSTAGISQTLRSLYAQIAGAGVAMAALAGVLVWWTSRRFTAPLEKMKEGADRFAQGQLDFRLELPDTREFAGLAVSLNVMAGQLQQRLAQIQRQQDESDAVFGSMDEGVIALDDGERILRLNPAAAAILGLERDVVLGRPLREVVRNPDLLRFVDQLHASGSGIEQDIVLHVEPERHLQVTGTPLRTRDGSSFGLLVVINDVTRLRRLETVRRDFVANVSHELRTPITSIKGFIETLTDGSDHSPEDMRRFHDIVLKQANRLNSIIDDLLKLSRIEQDQERGMLEREPVDIREFTAGLTQFYQATADAKRIRLEVDASRDFEVLANHALLDQAVGNLVDNAIKYSPEGTTVRVVATPVNGCGEIRVIDQGPGIEAVHLPRLYERFYRVDKARSRQVGGTGLGLAIVKHIALAHGGSVGVESRVGQGSQFWIRVPISR